jgi:hypothetical protein
METLYANVCEWLGNVKHEFFAGVNERAAKLQVTTGISIAELGAAKARRYIMGLEYERGFSFD